MSVFRKKIFPGLRIPPSWIETIIKKEKPRYRTENFEALWSKLSHEKKPLPPRPITLNLSYYPQSLEKLANDLSVRPQTALTYLQKDLEAGIIVSQARQPGSIWIKGRRWTLLVRHQNGKNTGRPMAVISRIDDSRVESSNPEILLPRVYIDEVWNESHCDVESILSTYKEFEEERRQQSASIAKMERELGEMRGKRQELEREYSRTLCQATLDKAADERRILHSQVRKQYSALQAMMGLLFTRSEAEKTSVNGTIASMYFPDENGDEVLVVSVPQSEHAGTLSEGTLVEIESDDPIWPSKRRARIQDILTGDDGKTTVLVTDMQWKDFCSEGIEVVVSEKPRFGMRAHKDAVKALLEEKVHGHWPDLARLLCQPERMHWSGAKQQKAISFKPIKNQPTLNDAQQQAVVGAVNSPHAFCIQGPPGTGKTTVICEIIDRLVARGERILLVAPTHVAVDEVLARIGPRPGIRPLRLAYDDSRVAEHVRKYTRPFTADVLLDSFRGEQQRRMVSWAHEKQELLSALPALHHLREAHTRLSECEGRLTNATQEKQKAAFAMESTRPLRLLSKQELAETLLENTYQAEQLRIAHQSLTEEMEKTWNASWLLPKLLSHVGLGSLAQQKEAVRQSAVTLAEHERLCNETETQYHSITAEIEQIEARFKHASLAHTRERSEMGIAEEELGKTLLKAKEIHILQQSHLTALHSEQDIAALEHAFRERLAKLDAFYTVQPRFDEIMNAGADSSSMLQDSMRLINLFCCTITGVAGSPELRDACFDTLILDEASRVTDSEFLIAATKAKRWILVGDERQLPPYVEQTDEHFIHALSAIHHSRQNEVELEESVSNLAHLWEEDEEHHKFRQESVLRIATTLSQGMWDEKYAEPYASELEYLREVVEDPTKALLRSMRDHLVRSLFERVVAAIPQTLCAKLLEQRRMIKPIAEIVRDPVYQGNYLTPPENELASRGVIPLTTATFPTPITFLDTSLLGPRAGEEMLRNSFINKLEAEWITKACMALERDLQVGNGTVSVSILTFYKAQARLIKEHLGLNSPAGQRKYKYLRFAVIDAIDKIQGQESDLVFLSFCRTNYGRVSPRFGQWLQDVRRLNVACTRAHRALIFVGQKALLSKLCSDEQAMEFYRHLNHLFETRPDAMTVVKQFGSRVQ